MEACEEMGLDKDTYSVTIPLGATINMDGAAITITVMALATAHTLGIAVDIPSAVILSVLATLAACGASGVAGGSLLLIPMACSLFGIPNDIAMQQYLQNLGNINQVLASRSDVVIEVCSGIPICWKGASRFHEIML